MFLFIGLSAPKFAQVLRLRLRISIAGLALLRFPVISIASDCDLILRSLIENVDVSDILYFFFCFGRGSPRRKEGVLLFGKRGKRGGVSEERRGGGFRGEEAGWGTYGLVGCLRGRGEGKLFFGGGGAEIPPKVSLVFLLPVSGGFKRALRGFSVEAPKPDSGCFSRRFGSDSGCLPGCSSDSWSVTPTLACNSDFRA